MRVALIAFVAALAASVVALVLLSPGPGPAPAPGAGVPRAVAPSPGPTVAPVDPVPAAAPRAAAAGSPPETGEEVAARALVERYREAAATARERVASLQASRPGPPPGPRDPLLRTFERPAPGTPQRRLWEAHVAPLLYPAGHPRAGEPLDHVGPGDLAAAADAMIRAMLPPEMLETPRRVLRLQQSFLTVQRIQAEHGIGRAFADAVEALPPDPQAPVYDPYFVLTDADDPRATTLAEFYAGRNLEQATELVESRREAE